MFLTKQVVAALLLTAPPDALDSLEWTHTEASIVAAMQALAIDWEIYDPREVRDLLARPGAFRADLKELQTRYRDLQEAPRLEEYRRFPQRQLVNDLLSFNRALRNDLAARLAVDRLHEEELRAALEETDQLYKIWDTVRDAGCEYYYINVRRQALLQLRNLLGPQAFYSGQIPPHVPTWRIPSAD